MGRYSIHIVLAAILFAGHVSAAELGLVLCNRLGSAQEIENSVVGLNGTIIGGGFGPGMFGDAYRADFTQDLQASFPKEVIPTDAGAIEFWGRIEGFPTNIYWGPNPAFFTLSDGGTNSQWRIELNGNNGLGLGGITSVAGQWFLAATGGFFGSNVVPYEQFLGVGQAEAWHHYALVWDRNGVPGVDGGTRKSAVFLDGQLDSTAFTAGVDFVPLTSGTLGLLLIGDGQAPDQGVAFIDNIKIWDFAKTDFSDRFVEGCEIIRIDHFKCYDAIGLTVAETVDLEDQFGEESGVFVGRPELFCNPVDKNGEGILDPTAHLTCYEIDDDEDDDEGLEVAIENQFGGQELFVGGSRLLCVPSEKLGFGPVGDEDDDEGPETGLPNQGFPVGEGSVSGGAMSLGEGNPGQNNEVIEDTETPEDRSGIRRNKRRGR